MNILTISKESFTVFFKNIHWFALYLLPLPVLLYTFGFGMAGVHLGSGFTLLSVVSMLVSIVVILMGLVLLERIKQKEGLSFSGVAVHTGRRLFPIIVVNILWLLIFAVIGVVTYLFVTEISPSMLMNKIALIIAILVALFLIIKYSLAQTLVVTEDKCPVRAFKRSAELMDGHKLAMLGLILLMVVIFVIIGYGLYLGVQAYAKSNAPAMMADLAFYIQMFTIVSQVFVVLITQLALIHIYIFYQKRILLEDSDTPAIEADV